MELKNNDIINIYESILQYYNDSTKLLKKYQPNYYCIYKNESLKLDQLINKIMSDLYGLDFSIYSSFSDIFHKNPYLYSDVQSKEESKFIYKEIPLLKNEFNIKSLYYPILRFKNINEIIKQDRDLFIQFIIESYKSKIDRLINQGGVKWDWLIVDYLLSNKLKFNSEISNQRQKEIDYGIKFHKTNGHIGSYYENNILIPSIEHPIYKCMSNVYSYLESLNSNYTIYDSLLESLLSTKRKPDFEIVLQSLQYSEKIKNIDFNGVFHKNGFPIIQFYNYRKEFLPNQYNYISINGSFNFEYEDIFNDWDSISIQLESFNKPENFVRKTINYPLIGEGWISETHLYYEIKNYFKDLTVINHARPKWLGKQHLDIFIPKLNIAIEYQGEQHFAPVGYFGGEETFKKNIERDNRKRELCRINNCNLIYVEKGYNLNDIINQISLYVKD